MCYTRGQNVVAVNKQKHRGKVQVSGHITSTVLSVNFTALMHIH